MAAALIYCNYFKQLDALYARGTNWLSNFAGYYFLYLLPFAAAFFLQLLFYKDCSYFKSGWFWFILFAAPAFFSMKINFNWHENIIEKIWKGDEQQYWLRCFGWVIRVLVVMLLLFFVWVIKDKSNMPFYGTKKLDTVKPYLLMLLIMIPLIAAASTQKDFLQMYPKAKFIAGLNVSNKGWRYFIYEICYGIDFISIEFFFRGFLILALAKICGSQCIVPVAVFYCTIHFGKPMGEAISSFWGGLLLGIVSFNTGSVWGGLIVHLGIAWLMEAGGWLGSIVRFSK
jgi:membrane protease YdiL (CAAX protease family)